MRWSDPIRSRSALRHAILDAETLAGRLEHAGTRLAVGERRAIAGMLRALADVARRAFDPHARHDWAVEPGPVTADADEPGLFPYSEAPEGAA